MSENKRLIPIIGIVLVVLGVLIFVFDKIDGQNVKDRVETMGAKIEKADTSTKPAFEIFQKESVKYPSHHWLKEKNDLNQTETTISNARQLLKQAQDALVRGDRETARKAADQIDGLLEQTSQAVNLILGPPGSKGEGLFDRLKVKTDAIDQGMPGSVENEIKSVQTYLDSGIPQEYLCGSSRKISYSEGQGILKNAGNLWNHADVTLKTKVEGLFDKPLAYDILAEASKGAKDAKANADNTLASLHQIEALLNSVPTEIHNAERYVHSTDYRTDAALDKIDSARESLRLATGFCQVQSFGDAYRAINNAQDLAEKARWTATRPTPTPLPTKTPKPVPTTAHFDSNPASSSSHSNSGSTGGGSYGGSNPSKSFGGSSNSNSGSFGGSSNSNKGFGGSSNSNKGFGGH